MDVVLPEDISKEELEKKLDELSNNKVVTSILLQLPLPEHLKKDTNEIMSHICSTKDVDGFTAENIGNLDLYKNVIAPCTPAGIIKMLKYENVEIDGKHVVIIGRSNIVGKPLAKLFLNENATVTICHSHTKDLKKFTSTADILVAAVGKAKFITSDMVKEDSIVIDVGINRVNGKLVGDVDFEHVKDKVDMITPVPGGVGKLTTAMLAYNIVRYI
jgi:methylenetetrahydrofolate dehydrogenase (NADP+)/methenyltetrahydrofolate cyclohydrolase